MYPYADGLYKEYMKQAIIKRIMAEVESIPREELLHKNRKGVERNKRSPFISKYVKQSKQIERMIKKYWPVLQGDKNYGKMFSTPPLFCYKKQKRIWDILCPAELPLRVNQKFLWKTKERYFSLFKLCVLCINN